MNYLNRSHPTIKFTFQHSSTSIDFLDLTIYKGERHNTSLTLDLKPFFKATNKFQYLKFTSAHPRSIFTSLVKGELTRLLRACSNEETYTNVSGKLFKALIERGYPNNMLRKTLQQVPFSIRDNVLKGSQKTSQTYDTFLKVKYSPDLDTKALNRIISPNSQERAKIPNPCLSLNRMDNLSRTLVRAKLKQYPDPPKSTNPRLLNRKEATQCHVAPRVVNVA